MSSAREPPLKVALAHDWLTGMRGGEAVLERLCRRYPDAPIYTLFHVPGSVSPTIEAHPIITSTLGKLPRVSRFYRQLLPLYPLAVEALDLRGFDLVVSTSHCAIKAIPVPPDTPHLCYVHTPMRYIYDQHQAYFDKGRASLAVRLAMGMARRPLQLWDRRTAARPWVLVANSEHTRRRIQRYWQREAQVVYPPVDLARFQGEASPRRGEAYLIVSALAPYKRIDLAIQAFTALGRPLRIAGDGQDAARLRAMAPPHVEFLGRVSDTEVARLYRDARALIFPGEEDFGITPVEAQAAGTPVIALARGGALETVRGLDHSEPTGVFFAEPTPAALAAAVRSFEASLARFDPQAAVASAARFSAERFDQAMGAALDAAAAHARRAPGG